MSGFLNGSSLMGRYIRFTPDRRLGTRQAAFLRRSIMKISLPLRCAVLIYGCLICLLPESGVRAMPSGPHSAKRESRGSKGGAKGVGASLRGGDVMATVEGEPITRRELTYFWISADPRIAQQIGGLLMERWKADRGHSSAYMLPETAIYAQLYGQHVTVGAPYLSMLSNLVTSRLLALVARRKGIVVTPVEIQAEAHRLLGQLRTQRGVKHTDEQILSEFHIPRDVFLEDMAFRLRADKLFRADLTRRNGHPLGPDDWIVVRALFASAKDANGTLTEERFTQARARLEGWAKEIQGGKSLSDVASEYNEDATRSGGGLHGPALRGTGTPAIEAAIFALKPGQLSVPLRGRDGWYIFQMDLRGQAIPEMVRTATWQQLREVNRPKFLKELRRKARVTSIAPLPLAEPPTETSSPQGPPPGLEAPPAPPPVNRQL